MRYFDWCNSSVSSAKFFSRNSKTYALVYVSSCLLASCLNQQVDHSLPEIPFYASTVHYDCETTALAKGTLLSDLINEGPDSKSVPDRFTNEIIADKLLFEYLRPDEQPCSTEKSRQEPHCLNILYEVIWDKWVYFYGDSTLRQVWAAFMKPFNYGDLPIIH